MLFLKSIDLVFLNENETGSIDFLFFSSIELELTNVRQDTNEKVFQAYIFHLENLYIDLSLLALENVAKEADSNQEQNLMMKLSRQKYICD